MNNTNQTISHTEATNLLKEMVTNPNCGILGELERDGKMFQYIRQQSTQQREATKREAELLRQIDELQSTNATMQRTIDIMGQNFDSSCDVIRRIIQMAKNTDEDFAAKVRVIVCEENSKLFSLQNPDFSEN